MDNVFGVDISELEAVFDENASKETQEPPILSSSSVDIENLEAKKRRHFALIFNVFV